MIRISCAAVLLLAAFLQLLLLGSWTSQVESARSTTEMLQEALSQVEEEVEKPRKKGKKTLDAEGLIKALTTLHNQHTLTEAQYAQIATIAPPLPIPPPPPLPSATSAIPPPPPLPSSATMGSQANKKSSGSGKVRKANPMMDEIKNRKGGNLKKTVAQSDDKRMKMPAPPGADSNLMADLADRLKTRNGGQNKPTQQRTMAPKPDDAPTELELAMAKRGKKEKKVGPPVTEKKGKRGKKAKKDKKGKKGETGEKDDEDK